MTALATRRRGLTASALAHLRYGGAAGVIACTIGARPVCAADSAHETSPQPNASVRLERCAVQTRSVLQDPLNGLRVDFVSGLVLRFVNLSRVQATLVRFTVRYQGSIETVTDRGAFATGIPVEHTFAAFAGTVYGAEAARCSIVWATYADGSSWSASPH